MPKQEQSLSHNEAEEEAFLIQQNLEKNQQPLEEDGFNKEQYQEEAEKIWKEKKEKEQEIERLKEEIEKVDTVEQPTDVILEGAESREKKVKEYQDSYLPEYLHKKGFVSRVLTNLYIKGEKFEKEGEENIPERGPFIVICNHFGGGDVQALFKTFEGVDLHFAVAKEMWWNSSAVARWFLKKLRMIPVEESLSNISEKEKWEALEHQGKNGKTVFKKIINREKQGKVATNIEFVRQAVAALSRGDALSIFPEGLWLNPQGPLKSREKKEMKQGYRGIELIARQYQRLTGEELPIVPTAFIENDKTGGKKIVIGKPLKLSKNDSNLNGTDWCMVHVAGLLPEKQRGYYKEMADEKR